MESKLNDINFALFFAPLVFFLLIGIVACSTTEVEPSSNPPLTEAASLPLIDPGFTLGMTLYGGADLPAPDTAERALLDTAVEKGLNGFT